MIDLKKLEQELDEALSRETPESLDEWLRAEREQSISKAAIPFDSAQGAAE